MKTDHDWLLSFLQRKKVMTTVEHKRMSSSSSNDETSKNTADKASTSTPSNDVPSPAAGDPEVTSRFSGTGVDFKGKLIGVEEVADPRGDKMCQVAMAKLKAGVKATGDHKQRITINVSLEGVTIIDEKTSEVMHSHEVSRISFIARDNGDSRAFGYVYRKKEGSHQFFGIKTEKAAEGLVVSLRDLFQTVYEIKKKQQATESKSEPEAAQPVAQNGTTETQPHPSDNGIALVIMEDVGLEGVPSAQQQPASGLSPSMNIFDPWASVPQTNATQPQPQQQLAPLFNIHQGGSSFYSQPAHPIAMPSTMMMPPFQSPGNAFRPAVQSSALPMQGFPGAASWPAGMVAGPAMGATQMGTQWTPAGSGFNMAATPHDPFAALAQPSPQGAPPMVPARRISPNNPFATSTVTTTPSSAARPDPFAELAVLSGAGSTSGGFPKKTDKKDFFQDPPKPSLFDLTQQQQVQQQQQFPTDLFGTTPFSNNNNFGDPFA